MCLLGGGGGECGAVSACLGAAARSAIADASGPEPRSQNDGRIALAPHTHVSFHARRAGRLDHYAPHLRSVPGGARRPGRLAASRASSGVDSQAEDSTPPFARLGVGSPAPCPFWRRVLRCLRRPGGAGRHRAVRGAAASDVAALRFARASFGWLAVLAADRPAVPRRTSQPNESCLARAEGQAG